VLQSRATVACYSRVLQSRHTSLSSQVLAHGRGLRTLDRYEPGQALPYPKQGPAAATSSPMASRTWVGVRESWATRRLRHEQT
jgi:hypothetical protein